MHSPSYVRTVLNSIVRNLNLDYDDYALVVTTSYINSRKSDIVYPGIKLELTTNAAHISSPYFNVTNEYHQVDTQSSTITTNYKIVYGIDDSLIKLYNKPGVLLDKSKYTIDIEFNTIYINDSSIDNIWISYPRKLSFPIDGTTTLSQLKTGIEALTYNDSQILSVTLSSNRNGFELADGLIRGVYKIGSSARYTDDNNIVNYGVPLRWSDLSIFRLIDTEFQNRYLNNEGHFLNTAIESYINIFKDKSHFHIGKSVCDHDVWDSVDELTEASSYLPSVLNQSRGYYRSSNHSHSDRFSCLDASERLFRSELDKSNLSYIGIPVDNFTSGIGDGDDLKVIITKNDIAEVLTIPSVFRATVSHNITGQVDDIRYFPDGVYGGTLFNP